MRSLIRRAPRDISSAPQLSALHDPPRCGDGAQVLTACLIGMPIYFGAVSYGVDIGNGTTTAPASAAVAPLPSGAGLPERPQQQRPRDLQELVRSLKGGAKGRSAWNRHDHPARA